MGYKTQRWATTGYDRLLWSTSYLGYYSLLQLLQPAFAPQFTDGRTVVYAQAVEQHEQLTVVLDEQVIL